MKLHKTRQNTVKTWCQTIDRVQWLCCHVTHSAFYCKGPNNPVCNAAEHTCEHGEHQDYRAQLRSVCAYLFVVSSWKKCMRARLSCAVSMVTPEPERTQVLAELPERICRLKPLVRWKMPRCKLQQKQLSSVAADELQSDCFKKANPGLTVPSNRDRDVPGACYAS